MTPKRILVLEDDDIVAEIVSEILSLEGFEVVCTQSGEQALVAYEKALLSDRPFHAVLLDLTIRDGMGGCETMQEIIRMDPRARGIVTSGYLDDPIMSCYGKHGFCGAVCKPFTAKELVRTVTHVLKN